ncbi:hypothetical protein U9M48_004290 [Paspalum notatum var. saurae]|uniref:EamA domain-containing protein n=1 Tax=Paspalum notatum var. saurae TaxID=547442 RepID=A0AAQ3SIX9_PASNO
MDVEAGVVVASDAAAAKKVARLPDADEAAGWKAPAAMVLVQLFNTGMVLLSKVAIGGGMPVLVLLAYRSLFGAAFILPLALLRERGKWKEMDWNAAGWIFLNAFIGYAVPMSLYYYGLQDTTASYAIIFLNIIPLTTFILCFIFSLYKGKILHLWNPVLHLHNKEHVAVATHQLRGTILLTGSSCMLACWYLIQSKVLKVYPYKYWSSMATCLVGGFQTALAGVIFRRDKNAWKIGWDINLVTIVYSGALATAVKYSLNSWAVSKKGPSYPPMFSPLSVVFTVVLGSIFIGDNITVMMMPLIVDMFDFRVIGLTFPLHDLWSQSKVLKVYPYKYWSSMATCLVGGFQTALAGVIFRRDKNAWKIGWDINLVTIVYSGALATAVKYSLNSWAVSKKGPSYPPMFSPLSVVFTVVLGSIFIGDNITVGSLIGTILVIVGTYVFLWAKANEPREQ